MDYLAAQKSPVSPGLLLSGQSYHVVMTLSVWAATVIANFLLIFAIIYRRSWLIVPMFSIVQAIGITFILVQVYLYNAPSVSQHVYHEFWLYTDQLSILLDALCVRELMEKCPDNQPLCWGSYLLLAHVLIKFHEYILREQLAGHHLIYLVRVGINLILTLLLAWAIYSMPKQESSKENPRHARS